MGGAYKDILWIEDFASQNDTAFDFDAFLDSLPEEGAPDARSESAEDPLMTHKDEVNSYIPEAYRFRVQIFENFYDALLALMEHADQYSCALLDINLENGFQNATIPPDVQEPFQDIQKRLAQKHICIRPDEDYATFQKNAGYYLYLYLIQSGMPEDRITILTANTGQSAKKSEEYQNLTDRWKELFEKAGMKAPHVIEKRDDASCIADVQAWFDHVLTPPYELRSCIMMMSRCLLRNLPSIILPPDAEGKKKRNRFYHGFAFRSADDYQQKARFLLDGLCFLPFRLPKDAVRFFHNIIWQIVQPWEATEQVSPKEWPAYGYWTTMRTARNWMAHDVIQKFDALEIEAFLFGLSMRGMFTLDGLPEDDAQKERTAYEQWEDVLLCLLNPAFDKPLNEATADEQIHAVERLTMESFDRFNSEKRAGGSDILAFYTNIGALICNLGTAKKKKACYASDLLRDFLHTCVPIQAVRDTQQCDLVHLRIQDNVLNGKQSQRPYYKNYLCSGANHDAPNRLWAYLASILPLIRDELDHNADA